MAPPSTPLWLVLRAAIDEREESVRHLAKLLHERDPSQTKESWKRTLNKYLDKDAEKPTLPSPATATLLAELLGKPADHFVRPQRRESLREVAKERDELREEVAELRRRLAEEAAGGSSSSQF